MQTLEEAQETNRRLNRRLQALEGPWQRRCEKAKRESDMWRNSYRHTFDRMLKAHRELKIIYIDAAKITGAPHTSFHSVMDGCRGWGENAEYVFANAFVPGGVKSIRVVDEVKRAIAGQKRPWLARLLWFADSNTSNHL